MTQQKLVAARSELKPGASQQWMRQENHSQREPRRRRCSSPDQERTRITTSTEHFLCIRHFSNDFTHSHLFNLVVGTIMVNSILQMSKLR